MTQVFASLFRNAQLRTQHAALRHLDDRLLSDIGLTRDEFVRLLSGQRSVYAGLLNG